MDWTIRADGGFSLTVAKGDFDPAQHQWGQSHIGCLRFGEAKQDGAAVILDFAAQGLQPVMDQAAVLPEDAVIDLIAQITRVPDEVKSSAGVLLLSNVQADTSMVYVDQAGKVAVAYAAVMPDVAGTTERAVTKSLLELVCRIIQRKGTFETAKGKQLLELSNDPYLNLGAVASLFQNESVPAAASAPAYPQQPTAPAAPAYPQQPMAPAAPAYPQQAAPAYQPGVPAYQAAANGGTINAVQNQAAIRMQPIASSAAIGQALQAQMNQPMRPAPVQQTVWSNSAVEAHAPTRSAIGGMLNMNSDLPTSDGDAPIPGVATMSAAMAAPQGGLNFNVDLPTSDDAAPVQIPQQAPMQQAPIQQAPMQQAPIQQAPLNFNSDLPTSDGVIPPPAAMPQTGAAGANGYGMPRGQSTEILLTDAVTATTVPEQGPVKPEKKKKTKKQKPPKEPKPPKPPKEPKQAKEPKPMPQEAADEPELTHEELAQRCWTARITLIVAVVGIILLMIILMSFASTLVVMAFLLLVVLLCVWAGVQGFFQLLIMPKKVKKEPKAPELREVFNVKMKLQSVNLSSVVEVTIREREQILGSSPTKASKPTLDYPGISRQHCKIICVSSAGNDTYYVEDMGSKNGTELNGMKLQKGNRYPLHYGDALTLAHRYKFVVHSDAY